MTENEPEADNEIPFHLPRQDETEIANGIITNEMAARNDEVTKADDIQKKWLLLKETWLKGSKQVCGMTKVPPRHKETWWWNRDVEKVVAK